MSNQWRKTPSELLNITDPLAAYYFNRAVLYFGHSYEADIEDAVFDAKSRSQAERAAETVRARWMSDEKEKQDEDWIERPAGYKDPADVFAEMQMRKRNSG